MATTASKLPREATQQNILSTLGEIKSAITSHNTAFNQWGGALSALTTGEKSSLVAAINYVQAQVTAQANAITAMNDIYALLDEASTADTGAGIHNSLYRGKSLGDTLTDAQVAAINARTFKGLWVGDKWSKSITFSTTVAGDTTQSVTITPTMAILDCDYYRNVGDSSGLTRGHIVVAPLTTLYTAPMNKGVNTTTGGYVGSDMYTKYLDGAKNAFNAFFGAAHILSHRDYLVNAVSDGKPSGGAWFDSTVELMDERQVYGSLIFDSGNPDGSTVPNRYSTGCKQFNLFRHRPDLISNRQYYWLRNVVSGAYFALVNDAGGCASSNASGVGGVRPLALIY